MLLHRDLDETQSSQQENSFDSQQGVRISWPRPSRQERDRAAHVIASRWLHHIGACTGRLPEGALLVAGVVLSDAFLYVGKTISKGSTGLSPSRWLTAS